MPQLNFGQPETGVLQMAYVADGLARSVVRVELDEPTEATFTRFHATSLTRDGSDAIRPSA